jgi:hypothetical protein
VVDVQVPEIPENLARSIERDGVGIATTSLLVVLGRITRLGAGDNTARLLIS